MVKAEPKNAAAPHNLGQELLRYGDSERGIKELETFRERQGVAVDTSTGYAAGYLEQSKYIRPLAER